MLALSRASRAVRESVSALSNCVCLESISRARIDKKGNLKQEERPIEIQATTIGDREWFSWPGSTNTFVQNPASLVGFGLMGSGELTSNLKTVFLGGFAHNRFRCAGSFQGRPGYQYDYSVSAAFTHYILTTAHASVSCGMQGSFWIDPRTGELLALSTDATEIPPDFGIQSAHTEVSYVPMYLAEQRVVLPQTALMRVDHADGSASINRVAFSHCRPYAATSSISFDEPPANTPVPAGQPVSHESAPLPAGMTLLMRLAEPINAHTAAGQRIALIMEAGASSHGDLMVAKSARVEARVRWIETTACPEPCLLVALELLSVTAADGTARPVYARLDTVRPESKVALKVSSERHTSTEGPFGWRRTQTTDLSIEVPEIPGVGSFFVRTLNLVTPHDFLMTWVTNSPGRQN